jgi:hypothetical protein
MYNPDIEMNEQMLIKIIKESELPIELKYESAKLIYLESINNRKNDEKNKEINEEKINQSLDLLLYIASNEDIEEIHSLIRVQILQSIIESERNMEKVKELLYQFLTDKSLEQYYRYKTVLNFSEKPNTQKEYIIEMFKMICLSRIFRTRYTILASQFFLGNEKLFTTEERVEVENMIISFCQDPDLDYELRSDAADLILTQGLTERNRQIAMDTIITLGQELGTRRVRCRAGVGRATACRGGGTHPVIVARSREPSSVSGNRNVRPMSDSGSMMGGGRPSASQFEGVDAKVG